MNIGSRYFDDLIPTEARRSTDMQKKLMITHSGRFTPVKFLFDKVGRVQVSVPDTDDRDGRIEAILEAASAAGGEDFEVLEETDLVEVSPPFFILFSLCVIVIVSGLLVEVLTIVFFGSPVP